MAEQCLLCHELVTPYWPGFVKCRSCRLVHRSPMPTPTDLAKLYDHGWLNPSDHKAETGGTDLDLARIYARKLAVSLGRENFQGQRLLDFGAGTGATLLALAELGAQVSAVEPFGYGHLKSMGADVYGDLDDLPVEASFDGIVTLDVIEHLTAPSETFARLRALLRPNGWILIATPNPDGLNARLFRSGWREGKKAGHLMFFNSVSLARLLRHCGYGNCRRLHWKFAYSPGRLRKIRDYVLQSMRLDGELRYLAHKG